jgi:hypothetical protein
VFQGAFPELQGCRRFTHGFLQLFDDLMFFRFRQDRQSGVVSALYFLELVEQLPTAL